MVRADHFPSLLLLIRLSQPLFPLSSKVRSLQKQSKLRLFLQRRPGSFILSFSVCAVIGFWALSVFGPSGFSVTVTKLPWSPHRDRWSEDCPWLCSKGSCAGQLRGQGMVRPRRWGLYAQGMLGKLDPGLAERKRSSGEK